MLAMTYTFYYVPWIHASFVITIRQKAKNQPGYKIIQVCYLSIKEKLFYCNVEKIIHYLMSNHLITEKPFDIRGGGRFPEKIICFLIFTENKIAADL